MSTALIWLVVVVAAYLLEGVIVYALVRTRAPDDPEERRYIGQLALFAWPLIVGGAFLVWAQDRDGGSRYQHLQEEGPKPPSP